MAIVGVLGEFYVTGFTAAASKLSLTLWENGTLFVFIALPLFLLMGQLAYRTGITDDLYDCISKWFGHMPGGIAVSAVLSNAAYGAVTGSSIASALGPPADAGPLVLPARRQVHDPRGLQPLRHRRAPREAPHRRQARLPRRQRRSRAAPRGRRRRRRGRRARERRGLPLPRHLRARPRLRPARDRQAPGAGGQQALGGRRRAAQGRPRRRSRPRSAGAAARS